MGLTISTIETDTIPRQTTLALACDGEHGLFPGPRMSWSRPDGFVENYAAAMKAGWLERQDKTRGRIFLCPDCSGKKGNPDANIRLL